MFKMFRKNPKTKAEIELDKIRDILFPPFDKQSKKDVTFLVDYSADSNLQAVLNDLEEGHNDEIVRRTVARVIDRMIEVRKVLKAYNEFDMEAQYIIVDDLENKNIEEIEVGREH
jgi:hypothetical protein